MDSLPANRVGKVIARFTGLGVTRAVTAARSVADQHGHPTYGPTRYTMTAPELGEAIPLAIAHSAGLTIDLAEFREAIVTNGLAAALAALIECIWQEGGAVVLGDTLTIDGQGRALLDRIQGDDPQSYCYGSPRGPKGPTFTLHGEDLTLIAQACRVAPSMAPRVAAPLVDGATVI